VSIADTKQKRLAIIAIVGFVLVAAPVLFVRIGNAKAEAEADRLAHAVESRFDDTTRDGMSRAYETWLVDSWSGDGADPFVVDGTAPDVVRDDADTLRVVWQTGAWGAQVCVVAEWFGDTIGPALSSHGC
jgi:hypothetical protein